MVSTRGWRGPMQAPRGTDRNRIAVVGGGVAALEAMLALTELGAGRQEVELVCPQHEFLYRPLAVTEPFDRGEILRFDLRELTELSGARFQQQTAVAVEPEKHRLLLHEGSEVGYDHLLIAVGAKRLWVVPGATTFWAVAGESEAKGVVEKVRSGAVRKVIFTMPSGSGWPLPIYELALLMAADVAERRLEVRLSVVTPEETPLQLFGLQAGEQVAGLLADHGIEVITGAHPVSFDGRQLTVAPGAPVDADAVITMPRLQGRHLEGIPRDQNGFIPVDGHCRVPEMDHVFAAGDVTAFPIKQGGIATQQAAVAAATIAAEAWGTAQPSPFDPVLRGTLLTGERTRFLSGRISGRHGETSQMSVRPLWQPQGKIFGTRLTPLLSRLAERPIGVDGEATPGSDPHP